MRLVDRTFVRLGWRRAGAWRSGWAWLIGGSWTAASPACCGAARVRMLVVHHVTYSINSLCHFFGERRFATGRPFAQPAVARASLARRVLAQQPSRLSYLRGPRPAPLGGRPFGAGHPRAREARAGVGRRPHQPRAPGTEGGVPAGGARAHRRAARELERRPAGPAVHGRALGRDAGCRRPARRAADASASVRRGAVAHALRAPGQLGLGRAYVSGAARGRRHRRRDRAARQLGAAAARRAADARPAGAGGGARLRADGPPPSPPAAELRPRGRRHSRERDARAVRHHYDLPAEFFALFLDESMTYSCAIFSRGATTLEEAQETKLELVCTQARPEAGPASARRRLRLGQLRRSTPPSGTASRSRASRSPSRRPPWRAARVAERGLADRVEIRVADYRELARRAASTRWRASAWSSTSARASIDVYARRLARLLRPGGRLLNHGIARLRHGDPEAGPFSERYVFPDGAPLHLSRIQLAARARRPGHRPRRGLARRLRRARSRHWARRLDERPRRGRAAGRPRARTRLAALPPRRPARVRERLHLGLPGPGPPARGISGRAARAGRSGAGAHGRAGVG